MTDARLLHQRRNGGNKMDRLKLGLGQQRVGDTGRWDPQGNGGGDSSREADGGLGSGWRAEDGLKQGRQEVLDLPGQPEGQGRSAVRDDQLRLGWYGARRGRGGLQRGWKLRMGGRPGDAGPQSEKVMQAIDGLGGGAMGRGKALSQIHLGTCPLARGLAPLAASDHTLPPLPGREGTGYGFDMVKKMVMQTTPPSLLGS